MFLSHFQSFYFFLNITDIENAFNGIFENFPELGSEKCNEFERKLISSQLKSLKLSFENEKRTEIKF